VFVTGIGEGNSDAVPYETNGNRCEAHADLKRHKPSKRNVEPRVPEIHIRQTELLRECSRKLVFEDPPVSQQNMTKQLARGQTLGKPLLQLRIGDHPLGKQQIPKARP
jgi:hypothetical protein